MTHSLSIFTFLGVFSILITYIQTILRNDSDELAKASYSTWGLFAVAIISYFLGMLLRLSFGVAGIWPKIYEFLVFFIWTIGLVNSVWFVILQGDHKNIKKFWGYLLGMVFTIRNGVIQTKATFFTNMLNLIYIFLISYGLVVLFCNLFTKYKKCDRVTTGTRTEYTIWVMGYLLWFVISSWAIKPVRWF